MNAPDLSSLVKGAIAVVGIAITLGLYGKLESWTRQQAIQAVTWKEPLPYFFGSKHHNSKQRHGHPKKAAHPSH
jgi:hypothetical protein